jgi:hypothetical protein
MEGGHYHRLETKLEEGALHLPQPEKEPVPFSTPL